MQIDWAAIRQYITTDDGARFLQRMIQGQRRHGIFAIEGELHCWEECVLGLAEYEKWTEKMTESVLGLTARGRENVKIQDDF